MPSVEIATVAQLDVLDAQVEGLDGRLDAAEPAVAGAEVTLAAATAAATANTLARRDAAGRLAVAAPAAVGDAAPKSYVDGLAGDLDTRLDAAETTLAAATAAATAGAVARRDGSGRLQVAAPNAGADATTKTYVDEQVATRVATTARGAVGGVAALDGGGKVPVGQLPAAAVNGPDLISGQAWPMWIAHRGGGALAMPEATMEAFRAAARAGFVVEPDVHSLADGTLVCCHDSTVNRTMTGSGNVSALTRAQWEALRVRPVVTGGDFLLPVTWKQLADEWGGRALLMPEVKAAAAVTPLLDDIERRGLHRAVVVQSFALADAQAAVARGIAAGFASDAVTDFAGLRASGVEFLCCSTAVATSYITSAKAAGLKVLLYTATTKVTADAQIARGADGVFSDDPWYHAQRYGRLSADPFGAFEAPVSGMVLNPAGAAGWMRRSKTGFTMSIGGGENGTATVSARQEWAGKLTMTGLVVRFRVTFGPRNSLNDQSRWCALYVGSLADDASLVDAGSVAGQNGYNILINRAGTGGGMYRVSDNAATVGAATVTSGAAAVEVAPLGRGGYADYEVKFTATEIVLTNLTSGHVVTGTDSTHRRTDARLAFCWRNVDATFSNVEIIGG